MSSNNDPDEKTSGSGANAAESAKEAAATKPQEYTLADFLGEEENDDWERDMQIKIARDSLDSVPLNDLAKRRVRMEVLGSQLEERFLQTGEWKDLEESISLAEEALSITPKDFPYRSMYRKSLQARLSHRYDRTGNIKDLEKCIQLVEENVASTSKEDAIWPGRFNSLGLMFYERYLRIGATSDLDKSIECIREAVNSTPETDIYLRIRLHNLGYMLGQRYFRLREIADLDEAILLVRRALEVNREVLAERGRHMEELMGVIPGDPGRAVVLNSLGFLLATRHQESGSVDDLQESIDLAKQAVEATPVGYPDRAEFLASMGRRIGYQFSRNRKVEELESAIDFTRQAIDATSEESPWRAVYLADLGDLLRDKYSHTKCTSDLDEAISCHHAALHQSNARTIDRILSGRQVLHYCALKSDWNKASEDAAVAVNLVPTLTARSLGNSEKQHVLRQMVGLACDAAAVALNSGKPASFALSLLEQGRGALAASLEEIRIDVSDLQSSNPDLAARFVRLREELDRPLAQGSTLMEENKTNFSLNSANKRYDAARELDELTDEIRRQAGFENFLLPLKEEKLQEAASVSPVIVVNVSEYRCDALIIQQDRIGYVRLPDLKVHDIEERAQKGDRGSLKTLEWLWDAVADPIMERLGYTAVPAVNDWPRVWWILTGPLSKFPLHAAGVHFENSANTVLDRVISSYSLSIKAIIHGRQRPTWKTTVTAPNQALLIAMEYTPGNTRLPFAKKEIAMLHDLCKSMTVDAIEPGRSKQAITTHLPLCKIFHFAGHGHTDAYDPSQSYLVLGEKDKEPLTVATLLEMNLRAHSPFLAYLSACGTGEIMDERFYDESLHLITACQLAGFRHVIGTLWEVNAESCVDMAKFTYEGMRDGGLSDTSVALGLHIAIRNLRESWTTNRDKKTRVRRMSKSKGTEDKSDFWIEGIRKASESKDRLARKIVLDDSDEEDDVPLHWVPYVHFGV